jgi:cell wall-associated NlpC family hydrolase
VRVRTLSSVIFCSLTILSTAAMPALATKTGGVAAVSPAPAASGGSTPTKPVTPAKPVHTDPVTAPTPNVLYTGPVYEKTATGEVVPYAPPAPAGQVNGATGGSPVGVAADTKPQLLVPGSIARYVDGLAAAPMSVPAAVQEIIWAGNQLIGLPYIFGGGHASFSSPGYDCSGTVSFALHGASLLTTPEDSSEFEVWGSHGTGRWVSIFSNAGHAYMTVAGLRLDTSAADDPTNEQGPRWRPLRQGNEGFVVRHPLGL